MRLAVVSPTVAPWRPAARLDAPQVFLSDSRLILALLNHLRYQALNRVFGISREQANVLTVVLLGAADSAYQTARRISGTRIRGSDAASSVRLRCAKRRSASPGRAPERYRGSGRSWRPRARGLAAPGLRRMARRMRAAERQVRRARVRRYAAEQIASGERGVAAPQPVVSLSGTTDALGARAWATSLLFARATLRCPSECPDCRAWQCAFWCCLPSLVGSRTGGLPTVTGVKNRANGRLTAKSKARLQVLVLDPPLRLHAHFHQAALIIVRPLVESRRSYSGGLPALVLPELCVSALGPRASRQARLICFWSSRMLIGSNAWEMTPTSGFIP